MENNKRKRRSILNSKKAMMAISLLLAIVIWLLVSLYESPEIERVVKDVKVSVDESLPKQLGYRAFGADNLYVDVTVKGRRYEIGDNVLSADDINVTAVTSYVDAPGKYTLQLRATSKNADADYTIVSKSQDYAEVYFDTPKRADFTLTPKVDVKGELLASDDYITKSPVISQDKLTVYGPSTEVDKISSVTAAIETDGSLKKSYTEQAEVTFLDSEGKPVDSKYLTCADKNSVTVTIPVYKKAELPISVGFSNAPSAYYVDNPLKVSVSPSVAEVAVDPEKLRSMDDVHIGDIDFTKLQAGENTFTYTGKDFSDAVAVDEDQEYVVTVYADDMSTASFELDSSAVKLKNVPSGKKISLEDGTLDITVVGPQNELDNLSEADISAVVNLKNKELDGTAATVPVQIKVNNDKCWVYGTYTQKINIK